LSPAAQALSLFLVAASVLTCPRPAAAQAPRPEAMQGFPTLLVTPTRLVFEGRARSAELFLLNNSDTPGTYRLSLQDMAMDEDGTIVPAEGLDQESGSASKLLRFSPRQVALAPGERQVIRVLVRKPAGLADGEYRSHLHILALPPPELGAGIAPPGETEAEGFQVMLIPTFAVNVPVIVRQGALEAEARISGLALVRDAGGAPTLEFWLERTGSRSVYGDLVATLLPTGGAAVAVAAAAGIAVYTPTPRRRMTLPLSLPGDTNPGPGRIVLAYTEPAEAGGALIAEAALELP
jgi:P pilus assembly chaperone PapD